MTVKQVLVIRRDLKMRRGKEAGQCSHSSQGFIIRGLKRVASETKDADGNQVFQITLSKQEIEWITSGTRKIVCQIDSEDALLDLHEAAKKAGLKSYLVKDMGLTEFDGKETLTCIAIGPDESEKIDLITGKLELY